MGRGALAQYSREVAAKDAMSGIDFSLNPIGPWPLILLAALAVLALVPAAYNRRLRGTAGAWRWCALGLRLAAILMCVLAMLRPSVLIMEKKKQSASLVFLVDSSKSMTMGDEVNSKTRGEVARETLKLARKSTKDLGKNLDVKFYRFDSKVAPSGGEADRRALHHLGLLIECWNQPAGRRPQAQESPGSDRDDPPGNRDRRRGIARYRGSRDRDGPERLRQEPARRPRHSGRPRL
jgi:hypothetical protein